MSRIVERDPFGRQTLLARRVKNPMTTCHWCGNVRTTRNKKDDVALVGADKTWLYQFFVEPDAGASYDIEHLYCSRECLNDAQY